MYISPNPRAPAKERAREIVAAAKQWREPTANLAAAHDAEIAAQARAEQREADAKQIHALISKYDGGALRRSLAAELTTLADQIGAAGEKGE